MGKTVVTATLARAAARIGLSTLVIEVEGKSGLASMFGQSPLDYAEAVLSAGGGRAGEGEVRARTLTPDEALLDYLQDHGLSRISKRLVSSGALDVVATAAPGIKDILILGKVKQLERAGVADLIVLDAPAAGHAITFLQSASALLDTVRVGPINAQARDVLDDADRPRPLPGRARHARGGDPGERAHRHRVQPRGPSGRGPRARSSSTASTTTSPASSRIRSRPRSRPGPPCAPVRPTAWGQRRRSAPTAWRSRWRRSIDWRTSSRWRRSGCRSCSRRRSGRPELEVLAERLLAEVDALPEVV